LETYANSFDSQIWQTTGSGTRLVFIEGDDADMDMDDIGDDE
jgi:hypothetical protein